MWAGYDPRGQGVGYVAVMLDPSLAAPICLQKHLIVVHDILQLLPLEKFCDVQELLRIEQRVDISSP